MSTKLRDGWVRVISKTHGLPYYVNAKKRISQWTLPTDEVPLFTFCNTWVAWAVINILQLLFTKCYCYSVYFLRTRSMSPPNGSMCNLVSMSRQLTGLSERTLRRKKKVKFSPAHLRSVELLTRTWLRLVYTAGNKKTVVGEVKEKMDDSELVPLVFYKFLFFILYWKASSFVVPFWIICDILWAPY